MIVLLFFTLNTYMPRLTIFFLLLFFLACKNNKPVQDDTEVTYEQFANSFKNATLPFQLSDTFLLKNKDTSVIGSGIFSSLLPDSTINNLFGKGVRVKYIPLWKIETNEGGHYFIIKTESNRKKLAYLFLFDKESQMIANFPFLLPDSNMATVQVSSIDKAYSISKTVFRKQPNEITAEGKDVFAYDETSKKFVLVMTDPLEEKNPELVNPIDTLSKSHKLTGDYSKDKRNIVSVRDGRKPNLLTVFVHIEKGDCSGELKGDAAITSPTIAVYLQPGEPCVLQLNFTGSSVSLTELEGCGSRRGLGCLFEGSFTRKKPIATTPAKPKKKVSGK